jgi:hypothetical protein
LALLRLTGNEALGAQTREFAFSGSPIGFIALQIGGIGVKNLRQIV